MKLKGSLLKVFSALAVTHISVSLLSVWIIHRSRRNYLEQVEEQLTPLFSSWASGAAHTKNSPLSDDAMPQTRVIEVPLNSELAVRRVPLELIDAHRVLGLYVSCCLGNAEDIYTIDLWNVLCALLRAELSGNAITEQLDYNSLSDLVGIGRLLRGPYALRRYTQRSSRKKLKVLLLPEKHIDRKMQQFATFLPTLRFPFDYAIPFIRYTSGIIHPLGLVALFIWNFSGFRWAEWDFSSSRFKTTLLESIVSVSSLEMTDAPFQNIHNIVMHSNIEKLLVLSIVIDVTSLLIQCCVELFVQRMFDEVNETVAFQSLMSAAALDYSTSCSRSLLLSVTNAVFHCHHFAKLAPFIIPRAVSSTVEDVMSLLGCPLQCISAWLTEQYICYLERKVNRLVPLTYGMVCQRNHSKKDARQTQCTRILHTQRLEAYGAPSRFGLAVLIAASGKDTVLGLCSVGLDSVLPWDSTSVITSISLPVCHIMAKEFKKDSSVVSHFYRLAKDMEAQSEAAHVPSVLDPVIQNFPVLQRSGVVCVFTPQKITAAVGQHLALDWHSLSHHLVNRLESLPPAVAIAISDWDRLPSEFDSFPSTQRVYSRIADFSKRFSPFSLQSNVSLLDVVEHDHQQQIEMFSGFSFQHELEFLSQLYNYIPRIDNKPWGSCDAFPSEPWSIEFDNVSFAYPGSPEYTLKNVTFRIAGGRTLGIVGSSGAGKTTLFHLLSRIYAPCMGDIRVGGVSITTLPVREYRRRLAVAWQGENASRFLQGESIWKNIAVGDVVHTTTKEIREALSLADILPLFMGREGGLQRRWHPNELSGGEADRLSMARAIVSSLLCPSVLLMDESMSAVDSMTEETILTALRRKWSMTNQRPTVLQISHRLASLQDCDSILVVAEGTVVEQGTWEELCQSSTNTHFHQLLASQ